MPQPAASIGLLWASHPPDGRLFTRSGHHDLTRTNAAGAGKDKERPSCTEAWTTCRARGSLGNFRGMFPRYLQEGWAGVRMDAKPNLEFASFWSSKDLISQYFEPCAHPLKHAAKACGTVDELGARFVAWLRPEWGRRFRPSTTLTPCVFLCKTYQSLAGRCVFRL